MPIPEPGILMFSNELLNQYASLAAEKINEVKPLNIIDELMLSMIGARNRSELINALMWPGSMPEINLNSLSPCEAYPLAKILLLNWPTSFNLNELRLIRERAKRECTNELDKLQLRLIKHSDAIKLLTKLYHEAITGKLNELDLLGLIYALSVYGLYDRVLRLLRLKELEIMKHPLMILRILLRGLMNITPWHRGIILSTSILNISDWALITVKYRNNTCIIAQFKSLESPYTVSNCTVQVEGGRLIVENTEPNLSLKPLIVELIMKSSNWGVVFIANNTNNPITYEPRVKRGCLVKAKDYETRDCGELYFDVGEYASIHFT
ncbi:hypothetical protein [Caldivirga sp. UBA161]|uniref:hypothetical protein n=1 Tax=Caldivirga sp. UBA161 TaxID=1915569 RepID=UPI0025B7ACE5|nr:hypothetical protein [Caldivirga sp. UBA161]